MTQALQDTVRALLTWACVLALAAWVLVTFVTLGHTGLQQTAADWAALVYPYAYLPASIYLCWSQIARRALVIAGVLLNLPLLAACVYSVATQAVAGIVVCALFLVLWGLRLL